MTILGKILKFSVFVLLISTAFQVTAEYNSSPFINSGAQRKVRGAIAKRYLQKGATSVQQSRSIVHLGSRRNGTCNLNIGAGSKKSKEIIVIANDITSHCGR